MISELIDKLTIAGEEVTTQKIVELINGGVRDAATEIVTTPTATVFESARTFEISAVMLTSTKVLVAYRDDGNSSYGTAIILNISDNTITPSTATIFKSAGTTDISAVMLTPTKVLVAYRDEGNSNYGTAIILNINGNTITPSTETVFENASTTGISAVMLTSTKVLVAYRDNGNSSYGTAIILNISDNTITPATATVFERASTTYISAIMLTSTKVLVAYRGNNYYGTAIILNINGNTITPSTETVFERARTTDISAVMLTSTKVLVAYRDIGNSSYGTAIILNISDNTITPATATVFERASTFETSAVMLTPTKVLVAYRDIGNSNYGTAIILNISDNTITPSTATVFESATTVWISAVMLTPTKVLVAYRDDGNSSYGTARILNIIGGEDDGANLLSTIYRLDTTDYTIEEMPYTLKIPVGGASSAVYQNRYIYVVGGLSEGIWNKVQIIDIVDGNVSLLSKDLPISIIDSGVMIKDDFLYVFGGYSSGYKNTVYKKNLLDDDSEWELDTQTLVYHRGDFGYISDEKGYYHIIGGNPASSSVIYETGRFGVPISDIEIRYTQTEGGTIPPDPTYADTLYTKPIELTSPTKHNIKAKAFYTGV